MRITTRGRYVLLALFLLAAFATVLYVVNQPAADDTGIYCPDSISECVNLQVTLDNL